MATTTQDFSMYVADTKDLFVTVVDVLNQPVDLTGAQIDWWLAPTDWKTGTESPLLTHSIADGGCAVLSPSNVFVVHIESTDTEGMEPGSYYHEAQVILSDGTVGTVVVGKVKLLQNIVTPR
jgi:hypothetical protein